MYPVFGRTYLFVIYYLLFILPVASFIQLFYLGVGIPLLFYLSD